MEMRIYVVVLDDGKGTGKKAEINNDNQLRARATTHAEEHWVSGVNGETYLASVGEAGIPTLTFLTTDVGDLLHLRNDSTTDIVVSAIICSADVAGGIVTLFKNKTEGTLTQNTPITPVNLNFGSAKIADATANVWDETNGNGILGLTGGSILRTFIMPPAVLAVDTRGTVIIPQGKSITINFSNNTGNTIEFECGFRFYYDADSS